MTIFVINVGDVSYGKYSLPFIEKICSYNKINLYILDSNIKQNIFSKHPSWFKLFCHSIVNDDFILCWDLDLIPTKLFNIDKYIDREKINLCYDTCYLNEGFIFNGKFRYNCGLIGIPKKYKKFFENIYYSKADNSTYPSYEQYHINDAIYDNNINIHLLENSLNTLFNNETIEDISKFKNMHYTWKIQSNDHRNELIKNHYRQFKGILN